MNEQNQPQLLSPEDERCHRIQNVMEKLSRRFGTTFRFEGAEAVLTWGRTDPEWADRRRACQRNGVGDKQAGRGLSKERNDGRQSRRKSWIGFFYPRSLAVIGCLGGRKRIRDAGTCRQFSNLGFKENSIRSTLAGGAAGNQGVSRLGDVPDAIDLAVVCLPDEWSLGCWRSVWPKGFKRRSW